MEIDFETSRAEDDDTLFLEMDNDIQISRTDDSGDGDEVNIQYSPDHDWSATVRAYSKTPDIYLEMLDDFQKLDRSGRFMSNGGENQIVSRATLNQAQRNSPRCISGSCKDCMQLRYDRSREENNFVATSCWHCRNWEIACNQRNQYNITCPWDYWKNFCSLAQ